MEKHPKKLIEEVQDVIALNIISYSIEKTYIPKRGSRGVRSLVDS